MSVVCAWMNDEWMNEWMNRGWITLFSSSGTNTCDNNTYINTLISWAGKEIRFYLYSWGFHIICKSPGGKISKSEMKIWWCDEMKRKACLKANGIIIIWSLSDYWVRFCILNNPYWLNYVMYMSEFLWNSERFTHNKI